MTMNHQMALRAAAALVLSISVCGTVLTGCSSNSGLGSLSKVLQNPQKLTASEIASGLKEALQIGITKGVGALSAKNGYYGDMATRIGLPSEASVVIENISKIPGGQALVDHVVQSINAAASDAAKEAAPIFGQALKDMTIQDASKILTSKGQAATDYFKGKTKTQLKALFAKHIDASINKKLVGDVSAQSSWNTLTSKWNTVANSAIGKATKLKAVNTNLSDYLTDKAVDGIFLKVAEQEKKIRTNVNERPSDLLRMVFAKQ